MPEKDSYFIELLRQAMPYITTVLLSIWGGVVNHITKLRKAKKRFSWNELLFDLIVSTFAGLMTFFFCKSAGVSETMSAVLISVSGHMGTRAIAGIERLYLRIVGGEKNDIDT